MFSDNWKTMRSGMVDGGAFSPLRFSKGEPGPRRCPLIGYRLLGLAQRA